MKKLLFINFCLLALTCKADIVTDSLYKNPSVINPFLKDKDNSVELKRVTRVLTFATFSSEIGWASFIDDPHKGFEINYTKQKMSRILSKGISVGLQPVSTLEQNVTLLDTLGVLKVRDQIVHGHITLRFSPLKFKIIQPYIDLIVGAQGSLLTSKFTDLLQENERSRENIYFARTWSYGYSAGVRIKVVSHFFLDLRYAKVSYGNLESIEDIIIEDNGVVTYTTGDWEAPRGYLRAGVSFSY
ncbi:MAG TPA: hypothetical protein EYF95_02985 [Flavobacteriales bacterium]|nr:hypothetical protein [Flavobacteriales bacterium]